MAWEKTLLNLRNVVQILLVVSLRVKLGACCPSVCQCGERSLVKYIECSRANFTVLPNDIPVETTELYFSRTQIFNLVENAFQQLPNLEIIEISNNQIENITDGVFRGLTKLTELRLPENGIKRISVNAFKGLKSLTTLVLSNNKLHSLPRYLLADLPNLQALNVNDNYLQELPEDMLGNNTKITGLYASNNRITSISSKLLKNRRLQVIFLEHNAISSIDELAFSSMSSTLMYLKLSSNRIETFPLEQLINMTFLLELRLDNNSMTTLSPRTQVFFDKVKAYGGKIYLSGNPFICIRELQWLQNYTKTSNVIKDMNDVMCRNYDNSRHRVIDYDFNNIATPMPTTATIPATTTTFTSTTTSTATTEPTTSKTPTIMQTTSGLPSTTAHAQTSTGNPTTVTEVIQTEVRTMSTTTESSPTIDSVSPSQQPSTSEVVTSVHVNYTSHSESVTSSTEGSPQIPGKADTKVLDEKETIVLATCVTAGVLAALICFAMYCFKKKVVRRNKTLDARYDRVSGVI
ncbi:chondroadherin isoform X2 [Nematostella vectensis]|uniref:chondroadherin isoform X2 n=1 Tax=Nematostella vectensis TaxID=45351 RepID=UPI002077327E|nr:chondroadherin isoform X2 [Nematostella vectensis]